MRNAQPGPKANGPSSAQTLAEFAASLRSSEIPAKARERATHCLIDAVACALHGGRLPWSRIVARQTNLSLDSGFLPVGNDGSPGATRETALVWGTSAHAYELDSLCQPSAGVHPGATVALPALAVARSLGKSGTELTTAIVAGCEVMFRIGSATLHAPERRGFHAPGLNGPFGAAIACGSLMDLTARQLADALGIAGSLGAGLLAFSRAARGGMIKRLHMGRAAEAGVLAAQLAASGFEGPDTVLEGQFGFLSAVGDEFDPALLTVGLGSQWKIESLCLKRYACHINAHAPVELLRGLLREHGLGGGDIESIRLGVTAKVLSHHVGRQPADIMQAQYSVPYSVAIAAYRDLSDPESLASDVLADPAIRRLAETMKLEPRSDGSTKGWGVEMTVRFRDGRILDSRMEDFPGCPSMPFSSDMLRRKFVTLAKEAAADRTFDILTATENIRDLRELWPRRGYA